MRPNRLAAVGIILVSSLLLSFLFTYILYTTKDRPVLAADTVDAPDAASAKSGAPLDSPSGGGGGASGATTSSGSFVPADGFAAVAEKASPAVVYIEVAKRLDVPGGGARPFGDPFYDYFFGGPGRGWGNQGDEGQGRKFEQRGLGSGFVVDRDKGYVLTNNHVIEGADEIEVTLQGGRKLKAKVVGTDPKTDVGLLQLRDFERSDLRELRLADSDDIRVGDWVLAIGNPFGLAQTVTSGIISAKGRANVNIAEYEDFIQTDAAINPGNSGGPLVNLRGEAIGMNTAIFSQSGGYMGIGFAVPANMLKAVMAQLVSGGKIERGQIGVMIQDVTDELKKHFDYAGEGGVLVSEVLPGSAAEKAGVRSGDLIVRIDGKPARDASQVKNTIGFTKLGKRLELTIWREGREQALTVEVGKARGAGQADRKQLEERLGLSVSDAADKPNAAYDHGVVVESLDPQGAAAFAGVRRGDLVLELNRKQVADAEGFFSLLDENKDAASILFLIDRRGHRLFLLLRNR